MIKDVNGIICPRNDTAANFKANNPVLDNCEIACESDTGQFKMGDGTNNWNDLPYLAPNNLNDKWKTLESNMLLSFGTYLIKVKLIDNISGVGGSATTFTDLISVYKNDALDGIFRTQDSPSGPLHIYVANGAETLWYKTARIKTALMLNSFKIELYISNNGAYALESASINGSILFPDKLASSLSTSEFSYEISYKRIM